MCLGKRPKAAKAAKGFFIAQALRRYACIYDIVRTANIKNINENQYFSVQLFVLLLVQSTILGAA
jgi:hypothetical protein